MNLPCVIVFKKCSRSWKAACDKVFYLNIFLVIEENTDIGINYCVLNFKMCFYGQRSWERWGARVSISILKLWSDLHLKAFPCFPNLSTYMCIYSMWRMYFISLYDSNTFTCVSLVSQWKKYLLISYFWTGFS